MEEYKFQQGRQCLPFGDVIQRTARSIHLDLTTVLQNMRQQSPIMRTQKLLLFIVKCKKRLAQLLAIARWLSVPGVSQFFANMTQLKDKIWKLENGLNELQDGLFVTHSSLFSQRLRSLDVLTARDILATQGSCHLMPTSMFAPANEIALLIANNNNLSTTLTTSTTTVDEESLRTSLNIYLRAKLALIDPLPHDVDYSHIHHGVLILRMNDLFELMLTLDYLDTNAPWNVLRFRMLVGSHPQVTPLLTRNNHTSYPVSVIHQENTLTPLPPPSLFAPPSQKEFFDAVQDVTAVESTILDILRSAASPPPMSSSSPSSSSSASSLLSGQDATTTAAASATAPSVKIESSSSSGGGGDNSGGSNSNGDLSDVNQAMQTTGKHVRRI